MATCRMNNVTYQHTPVLLNEIVNHLISSPSATYIDATFGRGGHAEAILKMLDDDGRLIALDKDPEAVAYGKQKFAHDKRVSIFHASYVSLMSLLTSLNLVGQIQGVLLDLGVSSPQLDDPNRGFSFRQNGALDMRMDTSQGEAASSWLAKIEEKKLADILWQYGEEKKSRQIAKAIVTARAIQPITTTAQLADIILSVIPQLKDKHPATRSFQAIRIAVNQELLELEQTLPQILSALCVGGRLGIISFHSLEDRVVKQFIHQCEKGKPLPRGLPIKNYVFNSLLKSVGKPIKPSTNETDHNPRARSAILRIAEKLS